jgi:hypothetical protein
LIDPFTPLRLKDGDVITMGASELVVHLSEISKEDDQERDDQS